MSYGSLGAFESSKRGQILAALRGDEEASSARSSLLQSQEEMMKSHAEAEFGHKLQMGQARASGDETITVGGMAAMPKLLKGGQKAFQAAQRGFQGAAQRLRGAAEPEEPAEEEVTGFEDEPEEPAPPAGTRMGMRTEAPDVDTDPFGTARSGEPAAVSSAQEETGALEGEAGQLGEQAATEGAVAAADVADVAGSAMGGIAGGLGALGSIAGGAFGLFGLGMGIADLFKEAREEDTDPYAKIRGKIQDANQRIGQIKGQISADQFETKVGMGTPAFGSMAVPTFDSARQMVGAEHF